MESIFKLGIVLSAIDKVSNPTLRIGMALGSLKNKAASLGPVFDKFKTYGLVVAGAGAVILGALGGMATASIPTQKALGELASVGVQNLNAVADAARKFSNQWAGTDQAAFITGAYDIKSGIASLSDTGVAEFTRLAALTAKATKSTLGEMSSLFATGHNIYKDFYQGMDDIQFGRMFSAGVAASVNAFKTTGSGMAQAFENLGASATVAGVPLGEQIAVLGLLQASMKSGSEAGTSYTAYVRDVGRAGKKLGLDFLDANNNIKSMPEVLNVLISRFGATWDAIEQLQIQSAFTDESWKAISRLYRDVGKLSAGISKTNAALAGGTLLTEQMAIAMNKDLGAGLTLLSQRFRALRVIIGDQLTPALMPLLTAIGNGIIWLQEFAMKHKTLTAAAVGLLAVIGSLAFALGSLAAIAGVTGLMWPNIVKGFELMTLGAQWLYVGLLTVIQAVWSFTAALLANPITWVVIGIVALGAGLVWLYKHIDDVRNLFGQLMTVLRAMGSAFMEAFNIIVDWITNLDLFEAGRKLLMTLVSGINSVLMAPYNAVKNAFSKITNLLNHSDAKEGPLSALTLNGQAIMQTLGAGVRAGAPGFRRQVTAALSGAALATSVAVTPMVSGAGQRVQQAAPTSRNASEVSKTYKIHIERIELPRVSDGRSFVRELELLVEGYDG